MPNGTDMLKQITFEQELETMTPDNKLNFIAREVYKHSNILASLPCKEGDCPDTEPRLNHKKKAGLAGGIVAISYALIELGKWVKG